jgi:hypothetical protein
MSIRLRTMWFENGYRIVFNDVRRGIEIVIFSPVHCRRGSRRPIWEFEPVRKLEPTLQRAYEFAETWLREGRPPVEERP